MGHNSSPFKWRHYAPDFILLCVRWYCRYSLSYRDLEELMRDAADDGAPARAEPGPPYYVTGEEELELRIKVG